MLLTSEIQRNRNLLRKMLISRWHKLLGTKLEFILEIYDLKIQLCLKYILWQSSGNPIDNETFSFNILFYLFLFARNLFHKQNMMEFWHNIIITSVRVYAIPRNSKSLKVLNFDVNNFELSVLKVLILILLRINEEIWEIVRFYVQNGYEICRGIQCSCLHVQNENTN